MDSREVIVIEKYTNYLYHMLAVAKVGYESEYSIKYEEMYDKEDLDTLRKYSHMLKINDGENLGEVYELLICTGSNIARNSREDFMNYFYALIDIFSDEPIYSLRKYEKIFCEKLDLLKSEFEDYIIELKKTYKDYKEAIVSIARIFLKNIVIYEDIVWEDEVLLIEKSCEKLDKKLKDIRLIDKWEEALNLEYNTEKLEIALCIALKGGPLVISCEENRYILYSELEIEYLVEFISHEIGGYIILSELDPSPEDFHIIESLIGFYNEKILGHTPWFSGEKNYCDFYRKCLKENKRISPKELYEKALKL